MRNILVNRCTEALRNRGDQEGYAQQTNLFVFLLFITTLPVKTDAWIARIDGALLIGFLAHDPEPEKIQAPLRARDSIEFDDYAGVAIDLSGRFMATYEFYVNTSGVQGDWVRNRVDDTRITILTR